MEKDFGFHPEIEEPLWSYDASTGRYTMDKPLCDPVVETVMSKFFHRHLQGMRNYGKPMSRTDIDKTGWMNHLQEELMDAILYIERLKMEESDLRSQIEHLQNVICAAHHDLELGDSCGADDTLSTAVCKMEQDDG